MIYQRAVSCPVVELPNIPFITELLCGGLLKERLWVFLCHALILGERRWYFLLRYISLFRHNRSMPSLLLSMLMVYSRKSVRCQSSSRIMYVSPLSFVSFDIWHAQPYQRTKMLTLPLCSSYRQILNGIPTPLLPNTPIIRIKLSKKVPIYA